MKTETLIHYELVDPTAAADGAPRADDKQPWVDLAELHDHAEARVPTRWGTLEQNEFLLDGQYRLFADDPAAEDMGLWSLSQSDDKGRFSQPPALTVGFSNPHTSLGLTLVFSDTTGDWCSALSVQWFDEAGGLLAAQDFAPTGPVYFCDRLVQNYYGLALTFRATNKPYRYLKLFKLIYGMVEELTGDRITEASLLEEADPAGMTVSVNTFRFGFYADRRFDLLDMSGVYSVFQQQQRVTVRQKVDGALREMGTFYTDTPEVEDQRAVSIDCIDLIGVIGQTDYMGGLWLDGIAAGELLGEIMRSAGVTDYEIDPALAGTVVKGYLPVCSHREAVQQLAFAIGAMVRCARSDKVRLVPVPTAAFTVIAPRDKVAGHRQTQRRYVSGVEVYTHHYALTGLSKDRDELFRAVCKAGEERVMFGSPSTSLSCEGAEIVESGVNYARLRVHEEGEVVLTGKSYEDQMSLGGSVYAARLPAGARANVQSFEDCTLTADPQAVAQRLYDYYQRRVEDRGDLFPVAAAAGDAVELQTKGGMTLTGTVESMDIDLTGGGIAKAVIAGG
ncbi:hypothetical protein NE562_14420 [Butyricicoccus faecihominis]|uniref:hypothetical protein n=1 Tax=Butyricicoccus faecihominis TaxID=1712515 RepID=UPI00247948DB|nr:hypothetical protein [Butyricicoccus faecihominis]MCQ5130856.1 hypothetical protein [Butyricicoccus faecihominis]